MPLRTRNTFGDAQVSAALGVSVRTYVLSAHAEVLVLRLLSCKSL